MTYIFHLYDFRKQATPLYTEMASTIEQALSLLSQKLGKKLEQCDHPAQYYIEKSDTGWWSALETANVRAI